MSGDVFSNTEDTKHARRFDFAGECPPRALALCFISGSQAGRRALLPAEGLVIGSNARRANICLAGRGVAEAHVAVKPTGEANILAVENLSLSLPVYFWDCARQDWVKLLYPTLFNAFLLPRIRLGNSKHIFEIRPFLLDGQTL